MKKQFYGPVQEPVARKNHECDLCGEAIPKGTKYVRWCGVVDGDFYNTKCHTECRVATEHWQFDDWLGFEPGSLVRGQDEIK